MLFDRPIRPETYAVIRFGLGFPARAAPVTAEAMLERLAGPDRIAEAIPFLPFAETRALALRLREARRNRRKGMSDGNAAVSAVRKEIRAAEVQAMLADLARAVDTDDPFRERLAIFWANHFTARAKTVELRTAHAGYAARSGAAGWPRRHNRRGRSAIRPSWRGR